MCSKHSYCSLDFCFLLLQVILLQQCTHAHACVFISALLPGQVLVTPATHNAYVSHREETWKFSCSASNDRNGTLHWELSQTLENRTTTRENNVEFYHQIELEISPPRAEVTINIRCTYKLESGETFSSWGVLNVKGIYFTLQSKVTYINILFSYSCTFL